MITHREEVLRSLRKVFEQAKARDLDIDCRALVEDAIRLHKWTPAETWNALSLLSSQDFIHIERFPNCTWAWMKGEVGLTTQYSV